MFLSTILSYVAPIFLVTSPLTSYGDQILAIRRKRSSRGFSLDTPLIMLIASILRCFYWLGADFERSLLYQSILMIIVQLTLLKSALDHRPPPPSQPFAPAAASPRPWGFWQWRNQRPYWEFLSYFTLSVAVLQVMLGRRQVFVDLLGYAGLGIEALLPLPQLLANQKRKSCDGFRVSVLGSWLLGDAMKMFFFFQSTTHVGLQFKLCAAVQSVQDAYLGVQFWMFGNGEEGEGREKEMKEIL